MLKQSDTKEKQNFIVSKIKEDLEKNKSLSLKFRFPPEPNGFLHIGHAKSICLNFGLAKYFLGATCYLRFDDTNPSAEKQEYIDSIVEDIEWLGFSWDGDSIKYSSDYFEDLYKCALNLINNNKAYICDLSPEQIQEYRGTLTQPGKPSPFRTRSKEENLKLFLEMKTGEHPEGSRVLRAKIDMAAGNINLRDPVLYRIMKKIHHRTGDKWCVYPTYDMTHSLCDAFEKITHSLCTLEFQDHRPLYDWIVNESLCSHKPKQIEFARLNLSYTITSKRKIKQLVDEKIVAGWDDPRLPTLKGIKRRGFTPRSIRNFCEYIGVAKKESLLDFSLLEYFLREDLNISAKRKMCVLDPIKVIITNYSETETETLTVANHPQDPSMGQREKIFSKVIYIDSDDFREQAEKKFHRLTEGKEVRLRYGYIIRCDKVIKDSQTEVITELHCSYDSKTLGKKPEGRKVKGVIHWLSEKDSLPATFNIYDRLIKEPIPSDIELSKLINSDSLQKKNGFVEKSAVATGDKKETFQFERTGYFIEDKNSTPDEIIFNRTTTLKETWK
jgi:glutaminyl-tRNA synthetase